MCINRTVLKTWGNYHHLLDKLHLAKGACHATLCWFESAPLSAACPLEKSVMLFSKEVVSRITANTGGARLLEEPVCWTCQIRVSRGL